MIPVGYMLKTVVRSPSWIGVESVVDIYSVSACVAHNFTDYIHFWKHNGYWLFDSPQIIRELAEAENIDVSEMTMFYYEAYETEYDDTSKQWLAFSPDHSFATLIVESENKRLEGYDVCTFSFRNSPECSPLSCNSLATEMPVNEHCLFKTFEDAKSALENGKFINSEPGPFRIIAVYKVDLRPSA
ncbi:MAG: hypothetical protein K2X27_23780 [Candidatus Obscuribacterales bacterium]|nr:hypothetical protein [Candidatus Obscuribacterales bacterium]